MRKFFDMSNAAEMVLIVIAVIVFLMILTSCIKIVPQAHAMIIERLGAVSYTHLITAEVKSASAYTGAPV